MEERLRTLERDNDPYWQGCLLLYTLEGGYYGRYDKDTTLFN